MKFLVSLAIMMVFVMSAMADKTATGTIQGKAEVMQSMAVTGQQALDFGFLTQGEDKSVDLLNGSTGLPALGTEKTGRFLVSAAKGSNVILSFSTPTDLLNTLDDTKKFPINTWVYGTARSIDNTNTAASLTNGDQVVMPDNVVSDVNSLWVFVGATVHPGASQASGTYSVDITLTATYN